MLEIIHHFGMACRVEAIKSRFVALLEIFDYVGVACKTIYMYICKYIYKHIYIHSYIHTYTSCALVIHLVPC